MYEIALVITALLAGSTFLNLRKTKKRLDTLEIVLAKNNILTLDDPAWKLNEADEKLLNELSNLQS